MLPRSSPAVTDLSNPQIKLLLWTETYGKRRAPFHHRCEFGPSSDPSYVNLDFVSDRSMVEQADVILFSASDTYFNDLPPKYDGQHWALTTMESPAHQRCYRRRIGCVDGFIQDPTLVKIFDWLVSYRINADVFVSYSIQRGGKVIGGYDDWMKPIPEHKKSLRGTKDKPTIAFMASDCSPENGRTSYVAEMMKYVPIDSYGKCLHNADLPHQYWDKDADNSGLLNDYKFYLAFENSNCKDYVTEKFYRAVRGGVIPVVLGHPDYSEFSPTDHAIIHAKDFTEDSNDLNSPLSPRKLAEYLKKVDSDDELFESYFDYKKDHSLVKKDFVKRWNITHRPYPEWCELAKLAFNTKRSSSFASKGSSVNPDLTCDTVPWDKRQAPTRRSKNNANRSKSPQYSLKLPGEWDLDFHKSVVNPMVILAICWSFLSIFLLLLLINIWVGFGVYGVVQTILCFLPTRFSEIGAPMLPIRSGGDSGDVHHENVISSVIDIDPNIKRL